MRGSLIRGRKGRGFSVGAGAGLAVATAWLAGGGFASGPSQTWTADADFDQGSLQGVEYTTTHDQLQLSTTASTFPFIWIANAGEDTVSKIDSNTGREVARYRTWFGPSGQPGYQGHVGNAWGGAAPSRSAVDSDGNVYVANRHFDNRRPSVTKILMTGGIDRNGNGAIDTSFDADNNGVISTAEIKPLADTIGNGLIDVSEMQDERVAWWVQVGGAGQLGRSLCIGQDGNIWVGTYNDRQYYKISGANGSLLAGPISISPDTPYGCLVDGNGQLWSASLGSYLGQLDTNTNSLVAVRNHGAWGSDYGIALGNGKVYQATYSGRTYIQFDPATNAFSTPASVWYSAYGINTDGSGNIFAAKINGGLCKFQPNGTMIWCANPQPGTGEVRGVVIDSNQDAWTINRSTGNISKYRGSNGAFLGVFPVGNEPYTYSDAAGLGAASTTTPTGFWTVVRDSGSNSTQWGTASWTSLVPAGAVLEVRVRTANTVPDLQFQTLALVSNNVPFALTGRYIEIQVKFVAGPNGASPVLQDLTIQQNQSNHPPAVGPVVAPDGGSYSVNEGGSVALVGSGSDPDPGQTLTYAWDLDNNGSFETPGQNVTFSAAGLDGPTSRTVVLQVCDDQGECATGQGTVNVLNVAPTANAGGPYTVPEGSSVALSGSGSDVPADTLTYAWDLDNNGTYETPGQSVTFSAAGLDGPSAATVVLQVCDDDGGCATSSAPLNVTNVAPTANAGPDQTQYWGLPVALSGSLTDPGVPDTHTASWTFGDGPGTASGLSVSHTYANPGGYTATLTVTDDDGGSGTDTAQVTINQRETTLAYTGDTSQTFGFPATLSAQLSDGVDAATAQLGGKTITFVVGGQTINATTNASGAASATLNPFPPLMPGAYPVAVSFAGDSHYLASSAQGSLQVVNTANGKVTAGTLRAANNGRGGFNVQADATGATVKGELQFQSNSLDFHAPTMTALGVSPDKKKAWFAGTGRDGRGFIAYVEDNGEPGRNDVFKLWVAGAPQNGDGALSGGNVQIH